MNKWRIAVSSLLVLIVVIVLMLYLLPNILHSHVSALPSKVDNLTLQVPNNDYIDSDGLTASEKLDAIELAINNPTIIGEMQNNYTNPSTIIISNVTSLSAGEVTGGIDSGFMNTSSKIAYLYVNFTGGPYTLFANSYAVYADLTNNKTLGLVTFGRLVSPIATVTIPPGSIWYTQVFGSSRLTADGKPAMQPYFSVNADDVNTTSMIILSNDNFDKFKKGLPYTPLKYVDYATNATMIADGSQQLHINSDNGIDQYAAYVSFNGSIPADANASFPNLSYYILIENKNKDKKINITYSN